jgi:hypothetical protein
MCPYSECPTGHGNLRHFPKSIIGGAGADATQFVASVENNGAGVSRASLGRHVNRVCAFLIQRMDRAVLI